jgi:hypothetical protein
MPLVVRHGLPRQVLAEFCQQARLAHARLPGNADHLPLTPDSLGEPRLQQRHILVASYKGTKHAAAAPHDPATPLPETTHGVDRHGHRGRSERKGRTRLALDFRVHQRVGRGTDEEGPRRRLPLQSRRQAERLTTGRVRPLRVVCEVANDHGPGVQPQAHRDAVRLALDRVGRAQPLAQFEGCQHGPAGMVLLRHRRPEQRHKALTGDLEQHALVVLYRVLDQRQHLAHQMVHGLGSEARGQRGCLGQGSTQHGDLFVFPVRRLYRDAPWVSER